MYVWYDPARERGILLIQKAQRKTGSIKKIPNAQLNLPYGEHSPWFKAQWTQETSQSNVEQIRRNNHPPKKRRRRKKRTTLPVSKSPSKAAVVWVPPPCPKATEIFVKTRTEIGKQQASAA
jgi:hypothetical protein